MGNVFKNLILTEKPSVARDYARILGVSGSNNGYIENDQWIITWCVGHLLAMSYPESYSDDYKIWSLDTLPFLPTRYMYEVIPNVREQFNIVKKLIENLVPNSTIYYAGDSGREGQVIAELLRRNVKIPSGVRELRVWIDSFTEEEIKKGIQNARPMSDYDNLSEAGLMRGIEDFAFGINFTRALTCKYGNLISLSGNKPMIAVGRVMTCVLGIIVDREHEINSFVSTDYYTVGAKLKEYVASWKLNPNSIYNNHPKLYNDNGFLDKTVAESVIRSGDLLTVTKVEAKDTKKNPPLLFNLAELQSKCSSVLHITPSETLEVAQSLYEKGFTTYPRTDARVLSTAILVENAGKIQSLSTIYPEAKNLNPSVSKPYVDDSKITDHYAIIPTGKIPNGLNDLENKVYDLIARRFLSIFAGPATISRGNIVFNKDTETFLMSGAIVKDKGYLVIASDKVNEEPDIYNFITSLQNGNTIAVDEVEIKDSKTQPPKRYTSGSIILTMENAGKFIEEESLREQINGCGIGTSATRAGILEKLIDKDFLSLNTKTQTLKPTEKGEIVWEIVRQTIPMLLSPKMTASWEKGLSEIETGNISADSFKQTLEKYVIKCVNDVKNTDHLEIIVDAMISNPAISINSKPQDLSSLTGMSQEDTGAKCPVCGNVIFRRKYGNKEWFSCEKYSKDGNGCFLALSTFGISDSDLVSIIANGKSQELELVSSKGKKFRSSLSIKIDTAKKESSWDFVNTGEDTDLVCPKCKSKIQINDDRYFCSSCDFSLRRELPSKNARKLSDEEAKNLFETGSTGLIHGLYSKKKRKNFDAEIVFDGNYKTQFKFK